MRRIDEAHFEQARHLPRALAERAAVMTLDEANNKSRTSSTLNWLQVEVEGRD
jgi:hypothetical protein